MIKLQISALMVSLLCVGACGSKAEQHRVAVGVPIEQYGGLPCKLEASSPDGIVKAEVTKASLMGEAKGIDATTVRLLASAPASATVSCKGSKHQVEFVEAKKISIENPPKDKLAVGAELRLAMLAYDAKGKALGVGNLVSDQLVWTLEGPIEHASGDQHPMLSAGANTTPVRITGKGAITVTAKWRGLSAQTKLDVN